jgi:hypothetical protein
VRHRLSAIKREKKKEGGGWEKFRKTRLWIDPRGDVGDHPVSPSAATLQLRAAASVLPRSFPLPRTRLSQHANTPGKEARNKSLERYQWRVCIPCSPHRTVCKFCLENKIANLNGGGQLKIRGRIAGVGIRELASRAQGRRLMKSSSGSRLVSSTLRGCREGRRKNTAKVTTP